MNGNHLKYMLLGGAGVFGVLLLVGVPLTSALLFAVVLACPLMMFTMGGHGGQGGHGGHGGQGGHGGHGCHGGAGLEHTSQRTNVPGEPIERPNQHQHHL